MYIKLYPLAICAAFGAAQSWTPSSSHREFAPISGGAIVAVSPHEKVHMRDYAWQIYIHLPRHITT